MRLTIIPHDSYISINGDNSRRPLDLSTCNIPEDIHALQWFETKGWIEFDDPIDPFSSKKPNELIDALPAWTESCITIWNEWTPPVTDDKIPYTIIGNN